MKPPSLCTDCGFKPEVRAERNVLAREVLDDADLAAPDLELDHHRAAFLHQPNGVVERLLARRVAHERHVDHEERTPQTARHAAAVIDDVVDRDGHRRVETLNDHAEAVADEHDVGAGHVDELREARVVRGQARNRLARLASSRATCRR